MLFQHEILPALTSPLNTTLTDINSIVMTDFYSYNRPNTTTGIFRKQAGETTEEILPKFFHRRMHIAYKSLGVKSAASTCKDPDIYGSYEARLNPSHTHTHTPPSTPHAPLFHIPLRLSLTPLSVMQVLQHGPLFTRALTASGWLVNAIIKTIPFQTDGFSDLVPFFSQALSLEY